MAIVNLPLPNQIADGQVADAVPLMANMNYIANQVNANAGGGGTFPPTILDTAYGFQAINTGLTSTGRNSAFGYATLQAVVPAGINGVDNAAFGYEALNANITGNTNTAIGSFAMATQTSTNNCTAIGYFSLNANTGNQNVAIGYRALTVGTGANNVSIGSNAMGSAATSANSCVAIGQNALLGVTTGNANVAIGQQAGQLVSSGADNVAIGAGALLGVTTESFNTAVGQGAMLSATGASNTALGYQALGGGSVTSTLNVASGYQALKGLTTGTNNTGIGQSALSGNTTFSDCSGLGSATAVTASSQVQLGDAATTTFAYGAVQNRSDLRDKADVRDTVMGLDFINTLRPVDYKWDMREDYRTDPAIPLHAITHDGSKKRSRYHHGFIAQEVHAASMGQFGGVQHHAINGGHDVWSIGEGELIAPLVKAVQELSAELAALKAKG